MYLALQKVRFVLLVFGVLLSTIIFSVSVAGLKNEEDQDKSIDDLGNILQVLVDWSDYTTTELLKYNTAIQQVSVSARNLIMYNYVSTINGEPSSTRSQAMAKP